MTVDGKVEKLNSAEGSFATNGGSYYVVVKKATAPVVSDNNAEIKDNPGGDVEVSDDALNPGETVTVRPKPDNGKVVDKITVTDNDGNELEVKDNGDGSYSFERPDGGWHIDVTFKDKTPVDIPETADKGCMWLMIASISMIVICVIVLLKQRKQTEEQ